jgi:hypothetical protein
MQDIDEHLNDTLMDGCHPSILHGMLCEGTSAKHAVLYEVTSAKHAWVSLENIWMVMPKHILFKQLGRKVILVF